MSWVERLDKINDRLRIAEAEIEEARDDINALRNEARLGAADPIYDECEELRAMLIDWIRAYDCRDDRDAYLRACAMREKWRGK